jgi:hypothetical protein
MGRLALTYVKTEWVNDSVPDIDAEHLNKIEQGILDAHLGFQAATDIAGQAKSDAVSALSSVNGHIASQSNPHLTTAKQVGARHHKNAIKRGCVANGVFDCTAILQALLDELRDAGGGELYLPNDGGAVYRTRGLWVPSNCRIVSEFAKVVFYDGGAIRDHSPDYDLIAATGFRLSQQRFFDGTVVANTGRCIIEGLTISVSGDGFQSLAALNPGDPYVTYYEANPFAGQAARKPSNNYAANAGAGLVAVNVACDDVTLRDINISGPGYDLMQIGGNLIRLERMVVDGGRRNCVTIWSGTEMEFFASTFKNCAADIPKQQHLDGTTWTIGVGLPDGYEYAPGCGVEIEPFGGAQTTERVRFRDCSFTGNGGAGLGIDVQETSPGSTVNALVVDGCYLGGNGVSGSGSTVLHGAMEVRGGSSSHAIFVANSSLISSVRGYGLKADAASVKVVASGNDLRWNAGGAWVGASIVDAGGNIT